MLWHRTQSSSSSSFCVSSSRSLYVLVLCGWSQRSSHRPPLTSAACSSVHFSKIEKIKPCGLSWESSWLAMVQSWSYHASSGEERAEYNVKHIIQIRGGNVSSSTGFPSLTDKDIVLRASSPLLSRSWNGYFPFKCPHRPLSAALLCCQSRYCSPVTLNPPTTLHAGCKQPTGCGIFSAEKTGQAKQAISPCEWLPGRQWYSTVFNRMKWWTLTRPDALTVLNRDTREARMVIFTHNPTMLLFRWLNNMATRWRRFLMASGLNHRHLLSSWYLWLKCPYYIYILSHY